MGSLSGPSKTDTQKEMEAKQAAELRRQEEEKKKRRQQLMRANTGRQSLVNPGATLGGAGRTS